VTPLTQKQARLVDYLRQRSDRGEPVPTYRELCEHFGWASTGTARDHLRALSRKGYVTLGDRKARRVQLRREWAPVTRVPVLGEVVAGPPIAADESTDGRVAIPAEWAYRGTHFALRVRGDSMKDAGILPGDQVVLRMQSTAEDNDIVAATVDGETTLKRLSMQGGRAVLKAANPAYRPIELKRGTTLIHGVVVGLLRCYAAAAGGRSATSIRSGVRHRRRGRMLGARADNRATDV